MLGLVESMRLLRSRRCQCSGGGALISVTPQFRRRLFKDEPIWEGERNAVMAHNIESRARVYKDHTVLVLMEKVHTEQAKGLRSGKSRL